MAQAALAVHALEAKKYWPYHGVLMQHKGEMNEAFLVAEAVKLGLKEDAFIKTMNSKAVKDILAKNQKLAGDLGVRGTPNMIIMDQMVPGAASVEALQKIIAEKRAQAKAAKLQ